MFDLIYQGALRLSEVTSIKINSFSWDEWFDNPSNPCKLFVMGKGKKERIVLINPETVESIINYCIAKFNLQGYEEINLFGKKPINLFVQKYWRTMFNDVWNLVNDASTKAIGRRVRPHELRHARSMELLKMGINERDIKNYLGHSSLATTEIYLHTSEKESLDNISNALKSKL
jgi:integrase/recombinase XerD